MERYEVGVPIDDKVFGQPDIKTAGDPNERRPQ
jgi:hypothetical protein